MWEEVLGTGSKGDWTLGTPPTGGQSHYCPRAPLCFTASPGIGLAPVPSLCVTFSSRSKTAAGSRKPRHPETQRPRSGRGSSNAAGEGIKGFLPGSPHINAKVRGPELPVFLFSVNVGEKKARVERTRGVTAFVCNAPPNCLFCSTSKSAFSFLPLKNVCFW